MIELVLPWPEKVLFPNRSLGRKWVARHKAKQAAREHGWERALEHRGKIGRNYRVPVNVVFCPPDRRRRDLDGMLSAMKPALDGVAAGLGVDDSQFRPMTLDMGERVEGGAVVLQIMTETARATPAPRKQSRSSQRRREKASASRSG